MNGTMTLYLSIAVSLSPAVCHYLISIAIWIVIAFSILICFRILESLISTPICKGNMKTMTFPSGLSLAESKFTSFHWLHRFQNQPLIIQNISAACQAKKRACQAKNGTKAVDMSCRDASAWAMVSAAAIGLLRVIASLKRRRYKSIFLSRPFRAISELSLENSA